MKTILLSAAAIIPAALFGQDSSGTINSFTFSGYVESYYSYDFNKPSDNNRPGFIYNFNRHNEFNVNLAILKGSYNADKVRASLALGAGTYMNANYATEPGTLKNIYEANAGFKLGKKNVWIDAGIFSSHIGFESAVGKDNWALTRSLVAENSPYYEAGAKITYTTGNNKWLFSGLVLNGWQRIKRAEGNSLMSFGTQITYKPTGNVTLNYSTFIGTDKPDSARQMRYYHNFYGIFQLTEKFGLTGGIDIGTEEKSKDNPDMNTWFSPTLIAKYSISNKFSLTARGEYFNDESGVIISTGTQNGFKTIGYSINADYSPAKNMMFRVEYRSLDSEDNIFAKDDSFSSTNSCFTTSFCLVF